MKKTLLVTIFSIVIFTANAQDYKNSLGLAFGSPSGISFKTFLNESKALDFTVGGFSHYYVVTGLYEIHAPLSDDFKWYYGIGAHIGSWYGGNYGEGAFLGGDGVIGLELKPHDIPVAFSLDVRPAVNIIGNEWDEVHHWWWWQSQLSVRYTF